MIAVDKTKITFESQLTLEEIKRNFEDADLLTCLTDALNEALEYEKGRG